MKRRDLSRFARVALLASTGRSMWLLLVVVLGAAGVEGAQPAPDAAPERPTRASLPLRRPGGQRRHRASHPTQFPLPRQLPLPGGCTTRCPIPCWSTNPG
jgi:hypothetical protein